MGGEPLGAADAADGLSPCIEHRDALVQPGDPDPAAVPGRRLKRLLVIRQHLFEQPRLRHAPDRCIGPGNVQSFAAGDQAIQLDGGIWLRQFEGDLLEHQPPNRHLRRARSGNGDLSGKLTMPRRRRPSRRSLGHCLVRVVQQLLPLIAERSQAEVLRFRRRQLALVVLLQPGDGLAQRPGVVLPPRLHPISASHKTHVPRAATHGMSLSCRRSASHCSCVIASAGSASARPMRIEILLARETHWGE